MSAEATRSQTREAEVLERRAARLAEIPRDAHTRRIAAQIAVLEVGAERIGIPVSRLREFVPCPPLATLPGLPSWMAGVAQIRGELLCAVDLAARLGIESEKEPACMAVLEAKNGAIGLLGQRVAGFRDVTEDDLAESYSGSGASDRTFIRGTTRDLVSILDADRLLADEELVVDIG